MNTAHTAATVLAAGVGLLAAPVLQRVAARRSLSQPLPHHPEEEARVIAAVLTRPGLYVYVHELEGSHFVDLELAAIWDAVKTVNADLVVPEAPRDRNDAFAALEKLEAMVPADLPARVEALLGRPVGELLEHTAESRVDREGVLADAEKVYAAGADRNEFCGSATIERTGRVEEPLRRVLPAPGPVRRACLALLTAAGAAVSVAAGDTSTAGLLLAASLLVLTVGCVIWTIVDLDTMYIDMRSFAVLGGGAWILALLSALAAGELPGALMGLLAAGGVVAFIEVVNQVYRRVRNQHGMGTGDYLLILATIGVPVALLREWQLGPNILVLSLASGLLGWFVRRLTEKGFTRETPYAFGPYLASGWVLALGAWLVI